MQLISSSLWPSLTAALPIPLPNQSCHLFALLLLLGCQEFLGKLNNHADWLCCKFMISHVSWALRAAQKPYYSPRLGWSLHSTGQLLSPHPPQVHTLALTSLNPNTRFHSHCWEHWSHQAGAPLCPSVVPNISESLLICTLFCTSGSLFCHPSDLWISTLATPVKFASLLSFSSPNFLIFFQLRNLLNFSILFKKEKKRETVFPHSIYHQTALFWKKKILGKRIYINILFI